MEPDAQAKPAPAKRPAGGRRGDARELGRVVRRYLGALEASRSSRGKRRTIEGISARLLKIDELLVSADPLIRLHLTQERIDLHAELVRITNGQDPDLSSAEKDFVRVAKQYGEVAGITYAAWRQVGVDTEVLDQAGIVRTGPPRPDASRVRRPSEGGSDLDAEPLLPRTEPAAALETGSAVDTAPAPIAAPTPEPQLLLEAPDEAIVAPVPAAEPTAAAVPPPPPRAPRAPKQQKGGGQAKARAAAAPAPPADQPDDDGPQKLRRKRIADDPRP
jgi:hypothetical protein